MDIKNVVAEIDASISGGDLYDKINSCLRLSSDAYYLLHNGKIVQSGTIIKNEDLSFTRIVPRVLGGKGGFGSMLRAIGAQIEKTTNREACRDLSGRRLRDINEEKRLKNWINQQAEREKEAKERRRKKLEKQCEQPKHEFKDPEYDKERSELPEIVEDAVLQGLQASSSSSMSTKRKHVQDVPIKKKKPKLWVDDGLELSSDEDESEEETENALPKILTEGICQSNELQSRLVNTQNTVDEGKVK
ncbi:splicing regulator SDE2 [Diorhabda carinulata]|uniref:splicing regulator SDE2 n=1 Tax=Diorhabda carinulata TaxID=1163345 RepID=UPI0025A17309|nr:splicing regulator SDE2 [Diorhabda carinulata]